MKGTNFPPEPIPQDERVELRERLARDYSGMMKRSLDLEVGLGQIPKEITDATQAQKVTDFLGKQIQPFINEVTAAHDKEKASFLALGRVCDSFFLAGMKHQLETLMRPIKRAMATFADREREERRLQQIIAKQKADAERRKAEQDAAAARAAAAALAATDRAQARQHIEEAKEAERAAMVATAILNQPLDKGHIHGDHGATGYLREEWKWECEDPTVVPLEYMMINKPEVDKAITAAVRQARIQGKPLPGIEIPGLRIYSESNYVAKG